MICRETDCHLHCFMFMIVSGAKNLCDLLATILIGGDFSAESWVMRFFTRNSTVKQMIKKIKLKWCRLDGFNLVAHSRSISRLGFGLPNVSFIGANNAKLLILGCGQCVTYIVLKRVHLHCPTCGEAPKRPNTWTVAVHSESQGGSVMVWASVSWHSLLCLMGTAKGLPNHSGGPCSPND